jgi:hypothetical protein
MIRLNILNAKDSIIIIKIVLKSGSHSLVSVLIVTLVPPFDILFITFLYI